MVGFYDRPVSGSQAIEAQGTEAIPSSTGEVLGAAAGGGFAHAFPTLEIGRLNTEMGIDPNTGLPIPGFHDADLSPEDANAQYGIKGRLSWTQPVPAGVAQEQMQRQREQIAREDVIARRESGLLTGGAARFGAALAGGLPGLVDPVNIAASFLPVVPEARAALWASRYGVAGRALTGAIEGAAGQAALTPLQFGLSKSEGEDYGAVDAILNIALGGIFGGGLHTGAALLGRRGTDLSQILDREAPETREALLRGAVADVIDDKPVAAPGELAARLSPEPIIQQPGIPEPITQQPVKSKVNPYETMPREPERLASFLQRSGGIQNQGGEIAQLLDRVQSRPGLINKNGLSLDDATLRAWEEGFLPGIGQGERPAINALLDALESDLKGHPVYSEHDLHGVAAFQEAFDRNHEIDRLAQEHGIDVRGLTRDEFYNRLAEKLGPEASGREAEKAASWVGEHVEDLPGFDEPRATLQELEDAHRQETNAVRADAGQGRLAEFAERGRAGAGEAGAGQGGPRLGARPGGPAELPRDVTTEPLQRLAEETQALDREIQHAIAAGELPEQSAELTAADEFAAAAEGNARAFEEGGMCLGRRL